MSTSNFPFNDADVPVEIKHSMGISNPRKLYGEPTSRDVPNSLQTSAVSPLNTAVGQPHATATTQSVTTAQSAPHRAWEEGYQSPFAQTSHSTFQPLPLPPSSFPASSLAAETPATRDPEGTSHRRGSYQPRARRVITKEITLSNSDVSAMVDLGLSPFMVGQDVIANQNRFVRNECILARQFLRLRGMQETSDGHHSQTERDIYTRLMQHNASLDQLFNRSGAATSRSHGMVVHPARADPDFVALEKAHYETCARLEALSRQVAEHSQSTTRALADLAQRLEEIIRTGSHAVPRSPPTTATLSPLLLSTSTSSLKRKWDSSADSILESPSTLPPPTPDFDNYRLPRTQ